MPAAIAIPAIIGAVGAGTSLISAKMQSNAATKAAGIQAASQDKAQQFNQQAYNDQRAALQPYVQGGQDAFSRLMTQHYGTGGLSPGMSGTAMMPGSYMAPQQPYRPQPQGPPPPGVNPTSGGLSTVPMGQHAPTGPPMQGASGPPQGAGQNPMGQAMPGQMVRLQAPDGSIEAVPADQVQHFLGQGARMVAQ